jgi:hypothetical protein
VLCAGEAGVSACMIAFRVCGAALFHRIRNKN